MLILKKFFGAKKYPDSLLLRKRFFVVLINTRLKTW